MDFLSGWTIDLNKIPNYPHFNKQLHEPVDLVLLDLIIVNKRDDYEHVKKDGSILNPTWSDLLDRRQHIKEDVNSTESKQKCGLGRFYGNSFITLPRKIKHTLFHHAGMVDLDQQKGHPTIACVLAKLNGEDFVCMNQYVNNPDAIFKIMAEHYGIPLEENKDRLKWFFNLTIYGGGYKAWLDGLTEPNEKDLSLGYKPLVLKTRAIMPFMEAYKNECIKLCELIWLNNGDMINHLQETHPTFNTKQLHEKKNCLTSYFMQIFENDALYKAYTFLKQTNLFENSNYVSLEYDGLCFRPSRELRNTDISQLNEYVKEHTGFAIKFVLKPYKDCNIYHDLIEERKTIISLEELKEGQQCMANFIVPMLKDTLVYSNTKLWYVYNQKTGLWDDCEEPLGYVVTTMKSCIEKLIRIYRGIIECYGADRSLDCDTFARVQSIRKVKSEIEKYTSSICSPSYSSTVIKFLKTELRDDHFLEKLDEQLYKIAYSNGVLDFKTNKFIPHIRQDEFISKTIPFPYERASDEDIEYVRSELKKICNFNDEHLNYYLSMLGYIFTGDSTKEQLFWFILGQSASNGKSVVFEILQSIMPAFVRGAVSNILDVGNDLKKEAANWNGLKLLWLNEVSPSKKDTELIKTLRDGTNYSYNRNYAINATTINIRFKLCAVSNHSLNVDGDAGLKRSFKLLQFNSHFNESYNDNYELKTFKADKNLSNTISTKYKHALLNLIFDYSHKYYVDKKLYPYPTEWQQEVNDSMDDADKIGLWLNEEFDYGADENGEQYMMSKADMDAALIESFTANERSNLKIRDQLKRLRKPVTYDSQKTIYVKGKRIKGWFIGMRKKKNDNIDDDTDEEF
jgi:phage/plasmid-associated DNA primase